MIIDHHMHNTTNTLVGIEPEKPRSKFAIIFGALLLVANLLLLAAAWQDRSWGALALALVGGPTLNGAFLISGLSAIPLLKRWWPQFLLGRHLALTLGVPLAVTVADFFIIMSMGLHGC